MYLLEKDSAHIDEIPPLTENTTRSSSEILTHGRCEDCGILRADYNWCAQCDSARLKENSSWTCEHSDIDNFIRLSQQNTTKKTDFIEWIPHCQFESISYITKGGFSIVSSAVWTEGPIVFWDKSRNQWKRAGQTPVVLKTLNNSQKITDEYLNEISGLKHRIDSKRLLRYYGITKDPSTKEFVLAVQYIPEGSLRTFLDQKYHTLVWEDKLYIITEIARGLAEIHNANLIHGDFHSGNILYNNNSYVISDVGLCRPADESSRYNKAKTHGVLPYVAPELLHDKPHSLAADVYSFGTIMWEVASGERPFANRGHNFLLALDICDGVRPKIVDGTPECYAVLMNRCWDARPEERPTATYLVEVLGEWCESMHQLGSKIASQFKESDGKRNTMHVSGSYNVHPNASYTSRLLKFKNLPEPKNINDPLCMPVLRADDDEEEVTKQIGKLNINGFEDIPTSPRIDSVNKLNDIKTISLPQLETINLPKSPTSTNSSTASSPTVESLAKRLSLPKSDSIFIPRSSSVEIVKKRFSLQPPESNKPFEKPVIRAGNIENLKKRFSQSQDDFKNIGGQSNKGGLVETLRKRFAQSQTNAPDMNMVVKTGSYIGHHTLKRDSSSPAPDINRILSPSLESDSPSTYVPRSESPKPIEQATSTIDSTDTNQDKPVEVSTDDVTDQTSEEKTEKVDEPQKTEEISDKISDLSNPPSPKASEQPIQSNDPNTADTSPVTLQTPPDLFITDDQPPGPTSPSLTSQKSLTTETPALESSQSTTTSSANSISNEQIWSDVSSVDSKSCCDVSPLDSPRFEPSVVIPETLSEVDEDEVEISELQSEMLHPESKQSRPKRTLSASPRLQRKSHNSSRSSSRDPSQTKSAKERRSSSASTKVSARTLALSMPKGRTKSFDSARNSRVNVHQRVEILPVEPALLHKPWNIKKILNLFKRWGPTEQLSFTLLSNKALMLIALVTMWYSDSDLGCIVADSVDFIGDTVWPDAMQFTASRRKSGISKSSGTIFAYKEDKDLCPVYATKQLLKQSDPFRAGRAHKGKLFLAPMRPYPDANAEDLGRMITDVFQAAGINVWRSNPNSSRFVLRPLEVGVELGIALGACVWTSDRSFMKRYRKTGEQKTIVKTEISNGEGESNILVK
ncbi:8032_t:CDS:2 [Paraglomus occultum]|uniref:8032_t:CDS:1 n=1 Tax=Paraglomus occultum TaxID=144539 RepID=A0A9N8YVE0_9GLOM|nr:8032_t:CDS:2 [Paraglomus occultum]